MSQIPYDEANIFAKIVRGELPCHKIFETEHALAILDAFPMAPGHSLLIPKALGFPTAMDMPAAAAEAVLRELPRLIVAAKTATGAVGVTVVQNNCAESGQIVFHAHFHVIPRVAGDRRCRLGKSAATMLTPGDAAPIIARLKASLSPHEPRAPPRRRGDRRAVLLSVAGALAAALALIAVAAAAARRRRAR